MSPDVEFEGKNVEQALEKACKELNISKERLNHDVISYGSTGIFGLVGSKQAKIRVVMPVQGMQTGDPEQSQAKHAIALNAGKAYDDAINLGKNVLQRIIDFITSDASISIEKGPGNVSFNITGGTPALLIGKHGQTLEAMQHLTEKVINSKIEQRMRIRVDVEGYLETRRSALKKMVKRLADKVKNTGKPVKIGQMNAYDRRIVHLSLKNDANVTVQSIGEGFVKKMMMFPKKGSARSSKTKELV